MRLFLGGALALVIVTAACSDNAVAPKSPADPQATAAELAALGSVFNAAPLQSLSSVSGSISPTASAPMSALALAAVANPLHHSTRLEPYARRIDAARVFSTLLKPEMSVNAAAALFPPALVGKTFEWDFTAQQYDTTARAGAPSNGVRFILYAIDPLTGDPAAPAPGTEVGYIDLKDEGSISQPKVHVIVAGVGGAPVYVDYTVSISSQSQAQAKINTAGYITNGAGSSDSLRFNGAITLSASTTSISVTEDVSFDVNSHDIHVRNWQRVTITQSGNAFAISLRLSFRFEHAGEVLTLEGNLNADQATGDVSGTVTSKVDGGLYATCSIVGTSNSYTLTCQGADADGLSADDNAALDALGEAASSVTATFEGILAPAIGILGA
jgi:hypothetical protein